MQLQPVIISAPFGNFVRRQDCTSTRGTYTCRPRGGKLWRAWRIAASLRYSWRMRSWRNKLGLPNPGIEAFTTEHPRPPAGGRTIVSVYGFTRAEWQSIVRWVLTATDLPVELNLSCPNVDHAWLLDDVLPAIEQPERLIAKLPPLRWLELAMPLYKAGIRVFHCCNTMPVPSGGLSGAVLKPYSLWAVEDLRSTFGQDVKIIGGGGVRCIDDVYTYKKAGADHVAIGSMLLNPFNHSKVPALVDAAKSIFG